MIFLVSDNLTWPGLAAPTDARVRVAWTAKLSKCIIQWVRVITMLERGAFSCNSISYVWNCYVFRILLNVTNIWVQKIDANAIIRSKSHIWLGVVGKPLLLHVFTGTPRMIYLGLTSFGGVLPVRSHFITRQCFFFQFSPRKAPFDFI